MCVCTIQLKKDNLFMKKYCLFYVIECLSLASWNILKLNYGCNWQHIREIVTNSGPLKLPSVINISPTNPIVSGATWQMPGIQYNRNTAIVQDSDVFLMVSILHMKKSFGACSIWSISVVLPLKVVLILLQRGQQPQAGCSGKWPFSTLAGKSEHHPCRVDADKLCSVQPAYFGYTPE